MTYKRLLFAVLLVMTSSVSFAYDFSAVAPSGQTLYYNIVDGHAEVVRPGTGSSYNNYVTGDLVIPSTVSCNGHNYSVTALTSISNNGTIYGTFNGCRNLTSVTIPNSISSIGNQAFFDCYRLTSVTIPNSVTSIGNGSFRACSGLTTVTIPNSVFSIGDNAFQNCSGLTSVEIPTSVTSIGSYAFDGCSNLFTVYLKPMIAPTIGSDCFSNNRGGRVFFIPCGSYNSYYDASSWYSYSSALHEEVGFSFNTQSADNMTGTVSIITEPTCQSRIATFVAIAHNGYHFSHWSDNNTDNPRMLILVQDTSVSAFFEINAELYNVTTNNALGGGVYESGSTVTVFALPQVNLQFAGWSDNETANPRHIIVTSDTTLTALYRAPDTVRIYDTTNVYDTVINMVYDTTEYNHYYYDTTRIYDTLVVFDTTRVFDTMVYVNIDTLHHYYYDTTKIYDTLVVFDTTRVFDTMVYVNIDTLHHYYYDTTRIFDTMVYVNVDTLHHYYYDTTSVTYYIFDSTWVFDSIWVFDSVYIFDTIYIHDTIVVGLDEVDVINAKIYTNHGQIVVDGAESNTIWLYDVNGRILATKQDEHTPLYFDVPASGTYLVKIGNHPARRVVVIR